MNNAYGDNYWDDAGQSGVAGAGDAYNDNDNTPAWAKEENYTTNDNNNNNNNNDDDWQKDVEVVKTDPPKKAAKSESKGFGWGKKKDRKTTEEEMTIEKEPCCSARNKRYLGTWTILTLLLAIGIIMFVAQERVTNAALIMFLIGLIGLPCSVWFYIKCKQCC